MFGTEKVWRGKDEPRLEEREKTDLNLDEPKLDVRDLEARLQLLKERHIRAYKDEFAKRLDLLGNVDDFCDEIELDAYVDSLIMDALFPSAMPSLTETPELEDWVEDRINRKDWIRGYKIL